MFITSLIFSLGLYFLNGLAAPLDTSSVRVRAANTQPSSSSSSPPKTTTVTHTGHIFCTAFNTNGTNTTPTTIGYLESKFNSWGAYGTFQRSPSGALQVSITYTPGSSDPVNLIALNPPQPEYKFVGGSKLWFDDYDMDLFSIYGIVIEFGLG